MRESKRFTTSDPTVEYSKIVTIVWDSKKCKHLIVDEVVDCLNEQQATITALKEENEQLKNYFKKRAECSNFQINKLKEEIEELKRERDSWKSSTCSYMNKDSILSMDCQIVHEALWELEKEIEFGSKREDLFFDLKEKFEKLNNHRIGVF